MKRKRIPKRRSLAARALESPLFRMRKIKPLKGKASYKRRPKHRGGVAISTPHIKLSETLVEQARIQGRRNHRSVPKQIEHWSMIGKIIEENPDLPFAMLQQILIGREEQTIKEYCFG